VKSLGRAAVSLDRTMSAKEATGICSPRTFTCGAVRTRSSYPSVPLGIKLMSNSPNSQGEVPDANACKGCRVVGEGKAVGYALGADPRPQIGECLRQPSQVLLGGPGVKSMSRVGGTAAACSSPAYPR
jgi:hypothetical protein